MVAFSGRLQVDVYPSGLKPTATKEAMLSAIKMGRWLKSSAHNEF